MRGVGWDLRAGTTCRNLLVAQAGASSLLHQEHVLFLRTTHGACINFLAVTVPDVAVAVATGGLSRSRKG